MKTKVQPNTFNKGPWMMKGGAMKDFISVTSKNRSTVIVIGRILYVIEKIGRKSLFRGTFSIDPCLTAGRWRVPHKPWNKRASHYQVTIDEDMNFEKWKNDYKILVDKFIGEGVLYVKPTDPLLAFYKD